MKSIVNNELGYTELIIEEEVRYQEDYQMRMLKECDLKGVVPVVGCGVDELSQYIYDVSGMQSIKHLYERECMNEELIKDMCRELLEVFDRVKGHMLDINKILLDPEYIFKNSTGYHFCYYPISSE